MVKIVVFTQSGCLTCEITKMMLEAKSMAFEERDITNDEAARRELIDRYGSNETPTLVIGSGEDEQVFSDLDPESLDQLLTAVSSSEPG